MDKIDWLTTLCKDNKPPTLPRPFSAEEIRGSYVLYATDRHAIIRVPCSKEDAAKFKSADQYLTGFFERMKAFFDGTVFLGQIDAMLLKEMANNRVEPVNYVSLDGAFLSKRVLSRALSGWEDTTAVLARSVPKDVVYDGKGPVTAKDKHLQPVLLHGKHALVIVAPAYFEQPLEEDAFEEFPPSAISYNR